MRHPYETMREQGAKRAAQVASTLTDEQLLERMDQAYEIRSNETTLGAKAGAAHGALTAYTEEAKRRGLDVGFF